MNKAGNSRYKQGARAFLREPSPCHCRQRMPVDSAALVRVWRGAVMLCVIRSRKKVGGTPMKSSSARVSELREVMDIRQASEYLGISPDTLYRYASDAFIPAFKLGNRWRFRRSRLDEWMDRQSGLAEQPAPKLVREKKKPVRAVRAVVRRGPTAKAS